MEVYLENRCLCDGVSITLFPPILLVMPYLLPASSAGQTHDLSDIRVHAVATGLSLIFSGLLMARMVSASVAAYESHWFVPILLAQTLIPLLILLLTPLRMLALPFLTQQALLLLFLLFGLYWFMIIKSLFLRYRNKHRSAP